MRDIPYTPGTDALRHTSPLFLQAQDLTATALVRLTALDNSPYTTSAGSRASLELLASIVSLSSLAATDLAHVVAVNPYEGAPSVGHPADGEARRTAHHAEAIAKMSEHLDDALHQLDLCATGCLYLAREITKDQAATKEHKPATARQATRPALTPVKNDALAALTGGGRLHETSTRRPRVTRVATVDGTRISISAFRALTKLRLVTTATSTSLFAGQKITVTELGQQALAQLQARAALKTAVTAPSKAAPVQGGHR